jgi:soluble lytic murein transglycosylase-like protein
MKYMVKFILVILFLGCLLFTLSLCNAARRGDRQMQTLDMGKPVKAYVRYPVPLDDDLQRFIVDKSVEKGVSPALVMAIIQRESNFDPNLIGDDGQSFGLMQIYASEHTARCIMLDAPNLLDPYKNVEVGIDILSQLMSYGKSLDWVLMAYNGGMTYAGQMESDGNVSNYAKAVQAVAERLAESVMVVTE